MALTSDAPIRLIPARVRWWAVVAAGGYTLRSAPVCSQPRAVERMQLTVSRDPRSDSCPDREAMRALLQLRLLRDPVDDVASRHAALAFTHTRTRFEARLRITQPGHRPTTRTLSTPASDCAPLGDAVGLVLALAIDPLLTLRAQTPPTPPATPSPPVEAPAPTEPPPALVPPPVAASAQAPPGVARRPVSGAATSWQLGALVTVTYGLAPGVATDAPRPGIALRVAPVRGRWMLPLEALVDLPGVVQDPSRGGRASALPVRVAVGLCARFGRRVVISPCATLTGGVVLASGSGYSSNRNDFTLLAAVGARLGVEVPLSARWRFVTSLDAMAVIVRPALELGDAPGAPFWTAPPLALSLSAGAVWVD